MQYALTRLVQSERGCPYGGSGSDRTLNALKIFLQHCQAVEWLGAKAICRLLCTSKQLALNISEHCTGRVPVVFAAHTLQHAQQLAAWIAARGALLQSLQLSALPAGRRQRSTAAATAEAPTGAAPQKSAGSDEQAEAAAETAAALRKVKALLRLTTFSSPSASADMLQQLPADRLTQLHLWGPQLIMPHPTAAEEAAEAALVEEAAAAQAIREAVAEAQMHAAAAVAAMQAAEADAQMHAAAAAEGVMQAAEAEAQMHGAAAEAATLAAEAEAQMHAAAAEAAIQAAEAEAYIQASTAIAALTSLRQLSLHGAGGKQLLPGVASLPQLTQLHLERVPLDTFTQLQQVAPPRLLSLSVAVDNTNFGFVNVQLAHLTALRKLKVTPWHFYIDGDDVLPPNLQELDLGECLDVGPLLLLKQLQQLNLTASTVAADELQLIGKELTNLTRVCLAYKPERGPPNAAAAGWPCLPLHRLELHTDVSVSLEGVTAETLQQLGRCVGLKELVLHGDVEASDDQLAAALKQLTALEYLRLWKRSASASETGPGFLSLPFGDVGMSTQAWQAVAGLPKLRSLNINAMPVDDALVGQVASMKQLTALSATTCGLTDEHVGVLVRGLPQLSELDVSWNCNVTDAVVGVLASHQPRLLRLKCGGTSVSAAGVRRLSALKHLRPSLGY